MIPITNKGIMIAECYDSNQEALDNRGSRDYTVASVLIDERKLYCLLHDTNAFKQVMPQIPGACYALVRKESQ